MSVTAERFSIVCISPQRWDGQLPTNRHQIMRRAAGRGHDVLFVETSYFLGRHLWRLVRGDGRRSLVRRLVGSEDVAPRVHARKALNLLPWGQKYALPNRLNCALTAWVVRRLTRGLPEPAILWLYDPSAAPLVGSCAEAFAVYDCVDDYAEQARDARRRALVVAGDEQAANRSRLVFATTRGLYARKRKLNTRTYHVPNVGDYDHFAPAADRGYAVPEVAGLPRPVVGFAGNLTPAKVDFGLLEAVARARPEWTVLLVGPARAEAEAVLERFRRVPNIRWLGHRPYAELPRYVAAFDVGIIPYLANDYTRSCFPLKVYEYLAAGKPVVASGLPELAGMEPDVVLAANPDEFIASIDAALGRTGADDRRRRAELAARNTWETRTSRLLDLIAGELGA